MAETNPTNVPVVLQVPTSVKALIEALIFGAREPLSVRQIQALYEDQSTDGGEPRKIDYEEINRSVEELNSEYVVADRPYRIIQIAGGYQFATLPLYAEWLGKLYKEQTRRKLSQSSVETLAIIAYKQPITKPEIESIRGVNCDYVLSTLLEKDLATIVGRAPTVGRPLLYGTSKEFLRHFGLNELNDLPRPREIQEILGDSQFDTERRMLEAQQGTEEKKEEDFKSRLPHIPKRKAGLDDDVKIFSKKRVRDIKVLPTEGVESARTEEVTSEQPVDKAVDSPIVPLENQAQPELIESGPAIDQNIPIIGDSETEATSEPHSEPQDVPTEEQLSTPVDQFEIPATLELVASEEEVKSEETAPIEHIEIQPTQVAEVIDAETTQTATVEETLNDVPEHPSIASIQVEEDVLNANKQRELQGSEELIAQVVSEEVLPSVQEIAIEHIPQAVAPSIEEQDVSVPSIEPLTLSEVPQSDSVSPHPKTRWKSWKEKIQGFIKKLFG